YGDNGSRYPLRHTNRWHLQLRRGSASDDRRKTMASEIEKRRRRKTALQTLEDLGRKEEHVLLVHYSCESFYDRPEGQTPRVTSIAVRNYLSAQTVSFSIHKIAEVEGVDFSDIENNYDRLEKE